MADSVPEPGEGERHASFTFDGDFILSERQIWPDGDAPDNWGVDDVLNVVDRCGGLLRVLSAWDLDTLLRLSVWVDGETGEIL